MSYKISIPQNNVFTGNHMGLTFTHGEAHTDDSFLATRLQSKGYHVAAETVAADEAVSDQGEAAEAPQDFEKMTVDALKKYAEEKKIDLGGAKLNEVHHVNKLKNLKGKERWELAMIAKKRKTLIVCRCCHRSVIHKN